MKRSSEIIIECPPEDFPLATTSIKFDSAVKAENFAKELAELYTKYNVGLGIMGHLLLTSEPVPEERTLSEQYRDVPPGETYYKAIRRYKEMKQL